PEDRSTNKYLKKGTFPVLNLPSSVSDPVTESESLQSTVDIPEQVTIPTAKQRFEEMPSTSATKQSASEEERQNREGKPCALLKEVGVTREIHLTPKARTLYHRATKLTKTVRTLKGRRSKLPRRQLYKQFNKDEVLDQITSPDAKFCCNICSLSNKSERQKISWEEIHSRRENIGFDSTQTKW
ncbi:hypothetical protein NQ315_010002, partial [Exocentrus adspersus]